MAHERLEYLCTSGAIMIMSGEPGVCGTCQMERRSFVNRLGETLCLVCFDQEQKAAAAKCTSQGAA